jgi:hypothetical protein
MLHYPQRKVGGGQCVISRIICGGDVAYSYWYGICSKLWNIGFIIIIGLIVECIDVLNTGWIVGFIVNIAVGIYK